MTYINSADAFNSAAANLEQLAGVDHYFEILSNPTQYPEHVSAAEHLDGWDCWLQTVEAD